MKIIYTLISIFCFSLFYLSCTKYESNLNSSTATPEVIVPPAIKFFNVMDLGETKVSLNAKQVTSVSKFYASGYITGVNGINNIKLNSSTNAGLLDVNPTMVNNNKYSGFFYKVGNEWKLNIVKDDMPANIVNGFAAIRVLDFRTEAYFNYINVRLISPGFAIIDQKNRNFLDHTTFDSYTKFQNIGAGTYSINMYNDTITSSSRTGVQIENKGIYSILLTTPTNIVPYADAIYHIYPDVAKHN